MKAEMRAFPLGHTSFSRMRDSPRALEWVRLWPRHEGPFAGGPDSMPQASQPLLPQSPTPQSLSPAVPLSGRFFHDPYSLPAKN